MGEKRKGGKVKTEQKKEQHPRPLPFVSSFNQGSPLTKGNPRFSVTAPQSRKTPCLLWNRVPVLLQKSTPGLLNCYAPEGENFYRYISFGNNWPGEAGESGGVYAGSRGRGSRKRIIGENESEWEESSGRGGRGRGLETNEDWLQWGPDRGGWATTVTVSQHPCAEDTPSPLDTLPRP